MTEASLVEAGPERNQAWADINKMIVEQAVGIPYVWDDNITLVVQGRRRGDERVLLRSATSRSRP